MRTSTRLLRFVTTNSTRTSIHIHQDGKVPLATFVVQRVAGLHHNVPAVWSLYNEGKKIDCGLFFRVGEPWAKLPKVFRGAMLADSKSISVFGSDLLNISVQYLDSWSEQQNNGHNSVLIHDVKKELCNWSIETTGFILFGERIGCVPQANKGTTGEEYGKGTRLVDSVAEMFDETSKFQLLPCRLAQRLNLPVWRRFERASDEMFEI